MEDKKEKISDKKLKRKPPQPSRFAYWWKWPLVVLIISLFMSFSFSFISQFLLSGAGIAVAVVVIIVFIIVSIIFDMIGVAVTAATLQPFRAMASKKVRGAKESINLVKNAEKVSSVCADIIGDICGILSGAAGSTVTAIFILNCENQIVAVLIASAVSAVIAGLTIFGKAMFKNMLLKTTKRLCLL